MIFVRTLPRALAVCLVLGSMAAVTNAQTATRPRQVAEEIQPTITSVNPSGRARLETDVMLISSAEEGEEEATNFVKSPSARAGLADFELHLLDAIEERIGTPYRLGTEGPTRFDCSGFVWSVFQEAGVDFERTSARTFWSRFMPVDGDEKFSFGTLVFFNNLNHVGIVADENGFYHASTSRGVVYSPFNEYWTKRITGFRRIPLEGTFLASAGR